MILISLFFFLSHQCTVSDTIRIGLLIQDKQSVAAQQGAELAIREANLKAMHGKFYHLVVRDMEGPWGTGAKESVSLVFDEKVCAVIGSIDGRNSHLAEQVSAKTQVPFISAWSSDPTLGQAFIPWFFSCVPNDNQTADILNKEIKANNFTKIVIVSDDSYDSEMSARSFLKKYVDAGHKKPEKISYRREAFDVKMLTDKLEDAECIIFFGTPSAVIDLRRSLKKTPKNISIIAPYMMMENNLPESEYLEGISVLNPGKFFRSDKGFTSEFSKLYGRKPGPVSAYAYDAVKMIIESELQAGDDIRMMYKYISGIVHSGVTGEISFDEYGNRKVIPGLIKLNNEDLPD